MKPPLDRYVDLVRTGPSGLFSRGDLERLDEHARDGAAGAGLLASLDVESIVDVGSGGGVPGIPIALELPRAQVHLVESQGWKAEFLRTCARALDLESRVMVHAVRAEQALAPLGRERLDAGIARAVARPGVVLEYLSPLVRVGGSMVLWTTRAHVEEFEPSAELVERLGLGERIVHDVDTPLRDHAVLMQVCKAAPCDERVPRRPGMATKRPLR